MLSKRLFLIGLSLLAISSCLIILIFLSFIPERLSQLIPLTSLPACLGGCGELPNTIGDSPISFLTVADEWPVQMNVNDSDIISLKLTIPENQSLHNYIAKRGNYEVIKATPFLEGYQIQTINSAFGSGYGVFAIAHLFATTFAVQLIGTEEQTVDQPSIEWNWDISPNKAGLQNVGMEIDLLWKSIGPSKEDRSLPLWRSHIVINVNEPFIDASQFTAPTIFGFLSGLGLTVPWTWEKIEKIVEGRKQKSIRKKISRRTVITRLGWTVLLIALGEASMWVRSSILGSPSIPLGRLLHTLKHTDSVKTVAWSPDGRYIASASEDATVQVWESASGNDVFSYGENVGGVRTVAWSPDSSRIASADARSMQVWDAMNGSNFLTYYSYNPINAVAWSPDNGHLACGCGDILGSVAGNDKAVQVWDVASNYVLFTYRGHSSGVNAVAWSPDGTRIASGSGDNTVQIWQAS